jgi:hypothetical protein
MSAARVNATASLLRDGGGPIAGGTDTTGFSTASADLFDPATGQFTATAGIMSNARAAGAAVSLPDGRDECGRQHCDDRRWFHLGYHD